MKSNELLIVEGLLLGFEDESCPREPITFIPSNVKDISSEAYISEDVTVDPSNPYLYSDNGCIYRRGADGDTLVFFSGEFEKTWNEDFFDEQTSETIVVRRHEGMMPYRMPDNVSYVEIHSLAGWYVDEIILSKSFKPTSSNLHSIAAARLSRIEVDPENPWLASVDGVLYDKVFKTLLLYPETKQEPSFTLPSSVKKISSGIAFSYPSGSVSSMIVCPEFPYAFETMKDLFPSLETITTK